MNILSRFLLTTIALVGVANGGLDSKTIYAQHEDEHSGHDDEGGVIVLSESELEEFGIQSLFTSLLVVERLGHLENLAQSSDGPE